MKPILQLFTVAALVLFGAQHSLVWAQGSPSGDKASVVVATVNNQTITAGQLDAITVTQLKGVTDPELQVRIKTQALTGLINQALVRQAIAQIDTKQNADWETDLKAMQEQGADNLYMSSRIGKIPEATPQLIEQIYRDNPDFYAKRYIYHYQVLSIPLSESLTAAEIERTLKIGSSGFDGVKELLKNRGIKYGSTNNWLSAEEINPSILAILKTLIEGQTNSQVSNNQKGILIIKSIGKYSDPVALEDASPAIAKKVMAARRNQLGTKVIDDLRVKAKIEINDAALATEVQKQQAIVKADKPATLVEQFKVSWYFALLLLVPAVLISFYRSPPAREQSTRPLKERLLKMILPKMGSTGKNMKKSIGQIAKEEFLLVWRSRLIQFVLMALAAIWFWMPLFEFFDKTPSWVTLQKLIALSFAGIGGGLVIGLVSWKVPQIHRLFTNRWVAVALLFVLGWVVLLV